MDFKLNKYLIQSFLKLVSFENPNIYKRLWNLRLTHAYWVILHAFFCRLLIFFKGNQQMTLVF